MKALLALLLLSNSLIFTSCSSMWLRRGQTVDSVQKGEGAPLPTTVSKEQYDELARKYQELLSLSKNQATKVEAPIAAVESKIQEANSQTKPEVGAKTSIDPSELVNRIDKAIPDIASLDTVDALKSDKNEIADKGPPIPASMGVEHVNNTDEIDDQIVKLHEVSDLVKANKFDAGLKLLKELENSETKQIVVRAKMML
jgi:phage shock protein A